MNEIPDHPVIRNLERTGTPDEKPELYPRCPVCAKEAEKLYKNQAGEVLGCDRCVREVDAWE